MINTYHEFLAIESPLTVADIEMLRSASQSFMVSTTGFIHESELLHPEPSYLLRRFFDAHVWLSSTHQASFQVRLPKDSIDDEALLGCEAEPVVEVEATPHHWLVSWNLESSTQTERFRAIDGSGWMSRLVPVREELLHGDPRSLYIGWLAAVTRGDVAEDAVEPMTWVGQLTAAQRALAEFLDVDPILLANATTTAHAPQHQDNLTGLDIWLESLSPDSMRTALRELIQGRTAHTCRSLHRQFRLWQSGTNTNYSGRRTVHAIWHPQPSESLDS